MPYTRSKLEAELARDEGEKFRCYFCSEGFRSVGIGRNLDANGISAQETAELGITIDDVIKFGITKAQSRFLFANDIVKSERELDRVYPWWRSLSDARQRVLLNMMFNMGAGRRATPGKPARGMLSFERGTMENVRTGKYEAAARGMLASGWAKQVGDRAVRLAGMMRAG